MDHPQRVSTSPTSRLAWSGHLKYVDRSVRERPLAWAAVVFICSTVILSSLWLILIVPAILGARSDVAELETMRNQSFAAVTPDQLNHAAASFQSLHANLARIDRLTALPRGQEWLVERIPWIGLRYDTSRSLLSVGLHLSDAGAVGAKVASQSINVYQSSGLMEPAPVDGVTWLDVIARNTTVLDRVTSDIARAQSAQAAVDPSVLPGSVQAKLGRLDSTLERYENAGLVNSSDRLALLRALGSDRPVRYLVLFQNPAELRPSGGFPGTMALVEIDRGKLNWYQIFDGHKLTDAYIAQRKSKRPEPWPIDRYFPQDGFLLHDAGWYADFPKAASTMMSMYAETDWPSIDGVIAIQPSVVADLLQVTGPLEVEIDGETRHVTADNVYDEIERQRRLIVEGIKPWDKSRQVHKEAVADIGEAIIKELKHADRGQIVDAAKLLMKSADVRDIQMYAADPKLESILDRRGWTGRLNPDPGTPTLSITFANVALQKSSEFMHPSFHVTASPVSSGRRTLTFEITVDNTGPFGEDPLYSGLQEWWIQIGLPAGFQRLSSSMEPQPDPEAPSGGSYVVVVNPQESHQLTVIISMPTGAPFLLRRQPGLTTALVTVDDTSCGAHQQFWLDRDRMVDLSGSCRP